MSDQPYGKMDPTIKTEWLVALRSGEREQGKGCLRSEDNRFCCLGVLADVRGVQWNPHPENRFFSFDGLWHAALPNHDPRFSNLSTSAMSELVHMNDTGKSFMEIANWIEANL